MNVQHTPFTTQPLLHSSRKNTQQKTDDFNGLFSFCAAIKIMYKLFKPLLFFTLLISQASALTEDTCTTPIQLEMGRSDICSLPTPEHLSFPAVRPDPEINFKQLHGINPELAQSHFTDVSLSIHSCPEVLKRKLQTDPELSSVVFGLRPAATLTTPFSDEDATLIRMNLGIELFYKRHSTYTLVTNSHKAFTQFLEFEGQADQFHAEIQRGQLLGIDRKNAGIYASSRDYFASQENKSNSLITNKFGIRIPTSFIHSFFKPLAVKNKKQFSKKLMPNQNYSYVQHTYKGTPYLFVIFTNDEGNLRVQPGILKIDTSSSVKISTTLAFNLITQEWKKLDLPTDINQLEREILLPIKEAIIKQFTNLGGSKKKATAFYKSLSSLATGVCRDLNTGGETPDKISQADDYLPFRDKTLFRRRLYLPTDKSLAEYQKLIDYLHTI